MDAAVVGLIGVILGAAIAGGLDYLFRKRTERSEARVASRIVVEDFHLAREKLQMEPADSFDFGHVFESWREHRATLARHATKREWEVLTAAVQLLAAIDGSRPGEISRPTPQAKEEGLTQEELEVGVTNLLDDRLLAGTLALDRLAYGRRYVRGVLRELAEP